MSRNRVQVRSEFLLYSFKEVIDDFTVLGADSCGVVLVEFDPEFRHQELKVWEKKKRDFKIWIQASLSKEVAAMILIRDHQPLTASSRGSERTKSLNPRSIVSDFLSSSLLAILLISKESIAIVN